MFTFIGKITQEYTSLFNRKQVAVEDQWTAKDIRNYAIYEDSRTQIIPSNYNKLPESRVWKIAQPGYLRRTPERFSMTQHEIFLQPAERNLVWDGTFNMPLEGLAHPLHKDAKCVDFITV
jgi:hypothetical protein